MSAKKILVNLRSSALISVVDFIKWTSTFGAGFIEQIDVPLSGVRLKPALSYLFGVAQDESGWMLTTHGDEGKWLPNFPFSQAFIGFDDEILLVSEQFQIADTSFPMIGLSIFIPREEVRAQLAQESTIGFGLLSEQDGKVTVQRVNRIIPLFDPARYEEERKKCALNKPLGLFS